MERYLEVFDLFSFNAASDPEFFDQPLNLEPNAPASS